MGRLDSGSPFWARTLYPFAPVDLLYSSCFHHFSARTSFSSYNDPPRCSAAPVTLPQHHSIIDAVLSRSLEDGNINRKGLQRWASEMETGRVRTQTTSRLSVWVCGLASCSNFLSSSSISSLSSRSAAAGPIRSSGWTSVLPSDAVAPSSSASCGRIVLSRTPTIAEIRKGVERTMTIASKKPWRPEFVVTTPSNWTAQGVVCQ